MSPSEVQLNAVATSSRSAAVDTIPQPFQCSICSKRFTRHENLKRHAVVHVSNEQSVSISCPYCAIQFSRNDLRRRHIKKRHSEALSHLPNARDNKKGEEQIISNTEPLFEVGNKRGNDGGIGGPLESSGNPSWATRSTGLPTIFDADTATTTAQQGHGIDNLNWLSSLFDTPNNVVEPPRSVPLSTSLRTGNYPRPHSPVIPLEPSLVNLGVDLFFNHLAHYFPFIHKPTFSASSTSEVLLMAMLSVSLQFAEQSDANGRSASKCYAHAKHLLEAMEDLDDRAVNLQVIQACLLLQMYALMLLGGSETKYGLRLHAKCMEMVRLNGLAEPYWCQPDTTGDLDALWRSFARAESHKRTFFSVYQLDAIWYQVLSTPRQMSHLEIKHELPCSEELWSASSVSTWAHRSLLDKERSTPKYITAVRSYLTPSSPHDRIGLDPYGNLLVTLFLLSSVREISGWSTMTGRVCYERFEALLAALKGMEANICFGPGSLTALYSEAMWRTAMIDLLCWSPAHTQGLVEYSVDAAIAAATHLGNAQPNAIMVDSLIPHLQWYLSYLTDTQRDDFEPPWITICAFKAALVAWQLVGAGTIEHVQALGITDQRGMADWIKDCFARRTTWGVGRLVMRNIQQLDLVC